MTSAGGCAPLAAFAIEQLRPRVVFAKFTFNGLQLLAKIRAALCVRKLRRQILLQLLLDLRDLKLPGDMRLHGLDAFRYVEFFEQSLLLRKIDIEVGRKKIGQLSPISNVHQDRPRLIGYVGRHLYDLHGIFAQRLDLCFPLLAFGRRRSGFKDAHLRLEKRMGQNELANSEAMKSLDNDKIVSSGWRRQLQHYHRRTDAKQILRRRIILRGIALRHQPDDLALGQ